MKRVATAVVLIPLVLLAVFKLNTVHLSWLVGLVAIFATKEYLDIAARYGVRPIHWPAYLFMGAVFALGGGNLQRSISMPLLVIILVTLVWLVAGAMRRDDLREGTLALTFTAFAYPYIGLSLACLVTIHSAFAGWFFIIFVFLSVWVGDTAAYYVGRSVGRSKLAPVISPKKTWEGAIASALFSAAAVSLWAHYGSGLQKFAASRAWELHLAAPLQSLYFGLTPLVAAILGLFINIAAQLGDLAESMIKRGARVKDSGTILPGHGGILDRIDALLFAAPVALLLFTLLDRFLAH